MRKFLALALAVAMVMSLAAVSFAANNNPYATVDLEGPFRYDADKDRMIAPGENKDALRYGAGVYYLINIQDVTTEAALNTANPTEAIGSYKEIEKLKVKAEFEMGADLVESVSIVKKYVQDGQQYKIGNDTYDFKINNLIDDDGYYYFVEFKVANKQTTADADIIGTLEFNRKADEDVESTSAQSKGIGKIKDVEVDFSFNVFFKDSYLNTSTDVNTLVTDEINLKYDTNYALKFECDDEVELNFGDVENDGTNEGTFTVDASGQGKLFVRYNTTPDEAIAAANPGVKMFFVNFNNAKFNRVGEFVYEMDDIAAAYKVVDGQLVEIKGLELDADSATFNTRVLESYVFADAELVNPVAAVEAPAVEAPAATNPSTGANA